MLEVKNLLSSSVLGDKFDAYVKFNNLVKDGARFDVKDKILMELGPVVKLGEYWYEYSITGNILYGFYGLAAGFDEEMLHTGAGVVQVTDLLRWAWEDGDCNTYPDFGGPRHYFDPPDDYYAVKFGMWLYNNHYVISQNLTISDFVVGLETYEYNWVWNRQPDPGNYIPATTTYAENRFDN